MYNFIFNFFYRYFKKSDSASYRTSAALSVGITIFFQLFLLANVFTFFTGINLSPGSFSQDYMTNKLCLMPIAMLYLLIFELYYNHKRAKVIVNKYPKDYRLLSLKNILGVFFIMLAPLIVGIIFLEFRN